MASKKKTSKKKRSTKTKRPRTTKNTGKPYEQLTREVFARMEPLVRVGAKVEHDVLVKGRSGLEHQIDVLITIDAGPVVSRTLIQCKDWGSPVKKSDVQALWGVINDVPGSNGFFVARSGYQDGAKQYAAHNGIKLYVLRKPIEDDWDGYIKEVGITMAFLMPSIAITSIEPDAEWAKPRLTELGVPPGQSFNFRMQIDRDSTFEFESGVVRGIEEIMAPYRPASPCEPHEVRHEFGEDGLMLPTPDFHLPKMRIKALTATVSASEHVEPITIDFASMVSYLFLDVLEGDSRFLGADGGPPRQR